MEIQGRRISFVFSVGAEETVFSGPYTVIDTVSRSLKMEKPFVKNKRFVMGAIARSMTLKVMPDGGADGFFFGMLRLRGCRGQQEYASQYDEQYSGVFHEVLWCV